MLTLINRQEGRQTDAHGCARTRAQHAPILKYSHSGLFDRMQ